MIEKLQIYVMLTQSNKQALHECHTKLSFSSSKSIEKTKESAGLDPRQEQKWMTSGGASLFLSQWNFRLKSLETWKMIATPFWVTLWMINRNTETPCSDDEEW